MNLLYNQCVRSLAVLALVAGCKFDPSGVGGVSPTDGPMLGVDGAPPSIDAPAIDSAPQPSGRRRKSITIDPTKVNGNQTDFPVWIDLVDADIAARAQPDGSDIFFTAADGTMRLDHQLQSWDGAAHHLSAWVRVPMLTSGPPTVLYVNYGDPAAAPAQNAAGVFRASFAAVWHLDDALPAATIADATGTHAGTPTLTTTTRTAAKLGAGFAFTGGSDIISFTNPLAGNAAHTVSVWVNQPPVAHVSAVLVVGTPTMGQSRWFYTHFTAAALAIGYYADDWTTTTNLDGAGWTLLHWVSEGGNGKNHLYQNGVEIAGSPSTITGVNTMGTTGIIGHAPEPAYGTNTGLQATIDELRIATVARTAGWISTEFANQSSPATFYTVGAEQNAP